MSQPDVSSALEWLQNEIVDFYEHVGQLEVAPKVAPEEIREHLRSRFDFQRPVPLGEVLAEVRLMLRRWIVHVTHPRCFGYFNPSVTPASVLGDCLTALYNPQLAVWSHAPAAVEIEQHVLRFFLERFGFDASTSLAHFTTGGAEANLTAVIVALTRRYPDYGDEGLSGVGAKPAVYLSAGGHESFLKIAHATGIGREAVRVVPTGDDLKIDVARLEEMVHGDRVSGREPLMVVGTAGTTAAGVIDPFPALVEFCQHENIWLHVDAAWGGSAILSRRLASVLSGIESADSITCDAHKWLSVPMGAGMFFCRHREAVLGSFRVSTHYMPEGTPATVDPYASTLQWSRRCIGLKVFLSLVEQGAPGCEKAIDHQTAMGARLRELLTRNGWELLNETPLPVICFTHERLRGSPEALRRVAAKVVESGEAWISAAVLSSGQSCLRACITSFRTQVTDLERLVQVLQRSLGG